MCGFYRAILLLFYAYIICEDHHISCIIRPSLLHIPSLHTNTHYIQPQINLQPNWDIKFLSMNADFTPNSLRDIILEYEIGTNRIYNTEIYTNDCASSIEGIVLALSSDREEIVNDDNKQYELLRLKYNFDMGLLTGSNIWNATSNHVQLCQIVELVYVDENTGVEPWVMTRDRRTLDIDVNLSIDFTVGGGGSGSGNDIGL